MTLAFVAAAAILIAAISSIPGAQTQTLTRERVAVTPLERGVAAARVAYTGRWEFVRGHARSFRTGDAVTYVYNGERLRVYGTVGPQGGTGTVILPDYSPVTIDFFAPVRKTHQLVYTSPAGAPGVHSLSIVVSKTPHGPHARGYVNLEGATVTAPQ